jgi:hypothetical protein
MAAGVPATDLACDALRYGAVHRDRWGMGLTTLMAVTDLLPVLDEEDRFLALFHGIAAVADDCDGEPARVDSEPLEERSARHACALVPPLVAGTALQRRRAYAAHRDRVLRDTATTLTPVTDRYFADGGHALDSLDKAFAGVDLVGWEHADAILPSMVPVLTASIGSEERDSWRHPADPLAERAVRDLSQALTTGRASTRCVLQSTPPRAELGLATPRMKFLGARRFLTARRAGNWTLVSFPSHNSDLARTAPHCVISTGVRFV